MLFFALLVMPVLIVYISKVKFVTFLFFLLFVIVRKDPIQLKYRLLRGLRMYTMIMNERTKRTKRTNERSGDLNIGYYVVCACIR